MSILDDRALDFAREHIRRYYDSDFFPKPFVFQALWHNWDDVKRELTSKNVTKLWVVPPRCCAAIKPNGTFRIVHQLEPVEAIVYTALAYQVAESVEAARVPISEQIACSFRIDVKDGSFFGSGNGFSIFNEKSEKLATEYDFVLLADITDFYNQIYLHRLNGAIEYADPGLKGWADEIENFVSRLNTKTSQGVPVGPAASVIMAEATLIDIDNFLISKGVPHTRYVDDFRIFSNDSKKLRSTLEELTVYLYENHRLTLASDKTEVMETERWLYDFLHNPNQIEKIEIFETLEFLNPYSGEVEAHEVEIDDEQEKTMRQLETAVDKILARRFLDLGLARSLIRTAKRLKVRHIADVILDNFEFFLPVINDVVLFLDEITDGDFIDAFILNYKSLLITQAEQELVRFWLEWYLSGHAEFLADPDIKSFVMNGSIENQARAAIATRDLAWIRSKKADIFTVGNWDRRAILNAARVLPRDEMEHWLRLTMGSSPLLLDRWICKWIIET